MLTNPGTRGACRDEVEDLCTAAVKEEQIEIKLRALGEQWGLEVFTFADHKQRGSVILKVCRVMCNCSQGCSASSPECCPLTHAAAGDF